MPRKAGALLLKSVSQFSLSLEASWAMSSPPNYSPYLEPSLTLPTKSLERIAVVQGLHAFWDVHFPLRPLQWRQNPNSPVIGRNFWHWEGNVLASRWVRSFRKKILLVPVLPFVKHSVFVSLPLTVTFSVAEERHCLRVREEYTAVGNLPRAPACFPFHYREPPLPMPGLNTITSFPDILPGQVLLSHYTDQKTTLSPGDKISTVNQ